VLIVTHDRGLAAIADRVVTLTRPNLPNGRAWHRPPQTIRKLREEEGGEEHATDRTAHVPPQASEAQPFAEPW
jgi:ABC-type lipoprotein export system ATPase subunit